MTSDHVAKDLPITALNVSLRARKTLAKLNVETVGDLTNLCAEDLMECKNFGETSLKNVRDALAEHGLLLNGDPEI